MKREQYLKDRLRNIYKFDKKSANSKQVQRLKEEAAQISDEEFSEEEEDLQTAIQKAADADRGQGEQEEEMKEKEYSFDQFLDSLKDRPGFQNESDEDSVFRFSDDENYDEGQDDQLAKEIDIEYATYINNWGSHIFFLKHEQKQFFF